MITAKKRVFVGMSGGVDSSVAAALLKAEGHEVTGVYMKNWTKDLPGLRCPWADDLADAKRVAVQLGIPFKVYDFEAEYKRAVVDYMIAEYEAGRTPNPDIMCNQEVKFKLFLETALSDGADMIATGHYAATKEGSLLRAVDDNKDQTYFLYRVSAEALTKTLFPLSTYKKPHVREIAREQGLMTANKRDSQGICFVGSVGIKDFLSEYVTSSPGDIVELATGNVVGSHEGAVFYTLGQRHGLGLGGGLPYYVVKKDMEQNIVYVSQSLADASMWQTQITLSDLHWINARPADKEAITVRMRHRGALLPGTLRGDQLTFGEPERMVAPGQSAVIYKGQTVLGGGIVTA